MSSLNKFLQKRAFNKLDKKQQVEFGTTLLPGVFSEPGTNPVKAAGDAISGIKSVYGAKSRLDGFYAGTKPYDGYDPHRDVATLSNFVNNENLLKNWSRVSEGWKTEPEGSWKRRLYPQITSMFDKRHALAYAAKNKSDFNAMQKFRGMGIADYLFGSADDNYKLLRLANGPMGAFLTQAQRNKIRNNYGLMKLIWRIKKFFSEFGNWKYASDPEHYSRNTTANIKPEPAVKSTPAPAKMSNAQYARQITPGGGFTQDAKNAIAQQGLQ